MLFLYADVCCQDSHYFFRGNGILFWSQSLLKEESMKKNILGPTWETDAISLKNYKQTFKKLLRNICHNYLSKIPKSDNKS